MAETTQQDAESPPVRIETGGIRLEGDLGVPPQARGLVIFAHGSGSSRHSPRNRYVAEALRESGLGTLLLDLLTPDEETKDAHGGQFRFEIDRLSRRLKAAAEWAATIPETRELKVGYFGAGTGGAAALVAAADAPERIAAIVSRGGRPDLAGLALSRVKAPTLLIVGGFDYPVLDANQEALEALDGPKMLEIVRGATHLFEEPGTLEAVARLARQWFSQRLVEQLTFEHRSGLRSGDRGSCAAAPAIRLLQ